jgi:aldose 1-epimerase
VRIAARGACVLGIEVTCDGVLHSLTDGYRNADELATRSGSRFAVMAPFANRIADARYVFDGVAHDLTPGAPAPRGIRHGFVRDSEFSIVEQRADEHAATVTFATAIEPGMHPGYPFALALDVRYTLAADGLTLAASMRNTGATAAPCFFGWHPYFRLGDTPIDGWELQIPAACVIRTDADSIPLADAAARVPLIELPQLGFRQPRAIGTQRLDHAFAELQPDADGRARTRLRDRASGLGVAVWQESGVLLAFTADTVSRGVRRSVALEPMASLADAFNRSDCAGAIRLEPGAERIFRFGVEILSR